MKQNITKRERKLIAITLMVGLCLGWLFFASSEKTAPHSETEHSTEKESVYTCSMHPQIKQNKAGSCPICGMDLVPMNNSPKSDKAVNPNEIQMSSSALALASVQTTIVKRGVPEKKIQLLGKVKPDERNVSQLTARFGGRIEKLLVNYTGQSVRKGQKLGTIYSPELITAQRELLESIKTKSLNPSFYKAARTKLKLWNLTSKQIDAMETKGEPQIYFEILSPITGTITKKHIARGDYVTEGSALFEIIDLSRLWVMFDAYESDLPWVKKGDHIEFNIQSVPGVLFDGKVSHIDPFINAKTRVAKVRVEINNSQNKLKPEMFANGVLKSNVATKLDEILIPKSAILWTGKRSIVYVKVPNRETASFLYREITLGAESGNFYIVSKRLSVGEEIVSNGVFKVDAASQLAGKSSMMNPKGTQNHTDFKHNHMPEMELEHTSFAVSGNCSVCKKTIESAVQKLHGVNQVNWNVETKMIHVSFNSDKVTLAEIHKAIAKAGYDTEIEKAEDSAYNNLPSCCQYTR